MVVIWYREKKDGVCEWYDIEGYALDKYVAEQGEF